MSSHSYSKKFLKLFAGCLPVRGVRRTVIIDTQRHKHYFIPNDLQELLGEAHHFSLQEAFAAYPGQEAVLNQYVGFLLGHELAFMTDEVERFPALALDFHSPETITNAVIDCAADSQFDFTNLAGQLDTLKCKSLQLRFCYSLPPAALVQVLAAFTDSVLRSIEVYVPYEVTFDEDSLRHLSREAPRLKALYLYGAAANKAVLYRRNDLRVVYVADVLDFPGCCGVVQPSYFAYGLSAVTEAVNHNSCLHRKVAIDAQGNIRNCPSLRQDYGNLSTTTLATAVAQPEFRKLWNVTKDQVAGCQDCEFRLICTDCRAYLEDPDNGYSKPLKCGYDPHTAQWQAWSTHPQKQAALNYYGLLAEAEQPADET